MISKYDNNPILNLYNALNLIYDLYYPYNAPQDNILDLILLNNGCKLPKDYNYLVKPIMDDYYLYIIDNGEANEANEFFDFIEFYGTKILVVFRKYFFESLSDDRIIGNSLVFNALAKIVEIFIKTTSCIDNVSLVNKTAAANNNKFIPMIIAGKILRDNYSLTDNDIYGINLRDLNKFIDNFTVSILGIRTGLDI